MKLGLQASSGCLQAAHRQGMAWHGTAWLRMARRASAGHGTSRHDTAQHGLAWLGMAWHGMAVQADPPNQCVLVKSLVCLLPCPTPCPLADTCRKGVPFSYAAKGSEYEKAGRLHNQFAWRAL